MIPCRISMENGDMKEKVKESSGEVFRRLSNYDIITFDVFDTLITRCVLRPADVFAVVEAKAKKMGLTDGPFSQDRREAERIAWEEFGDTANYQQIYACLCSRFAYTKAQCEALKALEFHTELELVTPRVAVRELLYRLLEAGKRIVLCSDMYLSSEAIQALLVRCGYPGDLELWVSSEKGATKSSGQLWRKLFDYLPKDQKSIHMGDHAQADHQNLKAIGRASVLISSGLDLFRESELYGYLAQYATADIGNSLMLGFLVNKACFNSPFSDSGASKDVAAIWCGGIFACFMDFLAEHKDDSQLLFVTREGFLLEPMYRQYCAALGVQPQPGTLFYASRAAALAASVYTAKDIETVMSSRFKGRLGDFLKSRLNFDVSGDPEVFNTEISLPDDRKKAMQALRQYQEAIIENSALEREAYQSYIADVTMADRALTVVDIGCNGTIQYGLSQILRQKVSGMYMFLNERTLPERMGCSCRGLRNPRVGQHPVYDNQLFLEAAMQVPYGQLEKFQMEDGRALPKFYSDANFSRHIPPAQESFRGFVNWIAGWKRDTGSTLKLSFELAEAIWVCLLKFRFLPEALVNSFWLADSFSGNATWKYDGAQQIWHGTVMDAPLTFTLRKTCEKKSVKHRVKDYVKAHIPYFAYAWAQKVWHLFLK